MWLSNYLLIFCLQFFGIVNCLRDVRISIPAAVRRGSDAALKCQYDIEADILYSVKWYRGDREFYRYMPMENPVMKVFPYPGIDVLTKHSNASVVTLSSVDESAAGRYSCEVSADAPSFHTFMVTGTMDVVDIPSHRPVISGVKPRYKIGSLLRGNCTSKHSRPAANLTWFINGQQANPSYIKRYKSTELIGRDGIQTAVSGIQFLVSSQHFLTGKLKIRCTASMYNIYYQSTEKSIEEERMKSNHGLGSNSINSNSVSLNGAAVPPESQHVALMYPVHGGTSYDQEVPPESRDLSSGSSSSLLRGRSVNFVLLSFPFVCYILRHLLENHFYSYVQR